MSRLLNDQEFRALNLALLRTGHPLVYNIERAGMILEPDVVNPFPIYIPGDAVNLSENLKKKMILGPGEQIFSHYIPIQFAMDALTNRKLFLRPLTLQSDWLEYEHCHAEAFAIWPLTRLDKPVNNEWNAARAVGRDVYVLCMTLKADDVVKEARFWKEYAGGASTAVRIDFSFKPKDPRYVIQSVSSARGNGPDYQLSVSKVLYDDGRILDTYKEIRTALIRLGVETFLPGFAALATRFKRKKFSWENEVRIILDTSGETSYLRERIFALYDVSASLNRSIASYKGKISFSNRKPPIEGAYLSFDNDHFTLNVESVTCGKIENLAALAYLKYYCSHVAGIKFEQL